MGCSVKWDAGPGGSTGLEWEDVMKRSLFVAIAGLAASGCYSSNSTYSTVGDVIVYWDFSRNVVGGSPVRYTCAQGGVDYVVATYPGGSLVDPATPTIPCVFSNVQGATFLGILTGPETFVITGYRKIGSVANPNVDDALFTGGTTITVNQGSGNVANVVSSGIGAGLDLFAYLYTAGSSTPYPNCAAATVDTVTYTLVDGFGTAVDSANNIVCGGSLPLLFFTGTVDLDNYVVRAAAYQGATHLFDSCSVPFNHFGTQTGGSGVAVALDNPVPVPCN
jgi:hypothetical protein